MVCCYLCSDCVSNELVVFTNAYCDYAIFISCEKEIVKERLIERKCKGGYTYEQAYQHYVESDSKNVELILDKSININMCLDYDGERYCIK